MKLKHLYKALIITLVVIFANSCNEALDQIGFTIQPGQDKLVVGIDTLYLRAKTVQVDSVYSKTKYPVIGEYTDPIFGSIKSEYMGEFYLPNGTGFKDGAVIDSVRAVISYTTMMGDSLLPMQLSVYEVNRSLQGTSPHTHIDPKEFADMSAPIGVQTFTGKNSTRPIVIPLLR